MTENVRFWPAQNVLVTKRCETVRESARNALLDYESPALTAEPTGPFTYENRRSSLPQPFVRFGHIASIIISADHRIAAKLGITDYVACQIHSRPNGSASEIRWTVRDCQD